MPPPVIVLETQADVEAFLANPAAPQSVTKGLDKYRVESKWIESLIDAIEAEGQYPYNAVVNKRAQLAMGWPEKTEAEYAREGTPLSLLIYNAQSYRRSNKLRAAGFEPFTQKLVDKLGAMGVIYGHHR